MPRRSACTRCGSATTSCPVVVDCTIRRLRTTYLNFPRKETFQAVGVRLRECLISFLGETAADELVSEGTQRPKQTDFRAWTELLANALAPGSRRPSCART